MEDRPLLTELTANIVAAYVSRADVARGELAKLISEVYGALANAADGKMPGAQPVPARAESKIRKSIYPDYLICLEDGGKFKSLKRHLRVKYALSPEQYRAKWDLAADYPMVAPKYAEIRSKLAKNMGLGRKPKKRK